MNILKTCFATLIVMTILAAGTSAATAGRDNPNFRANLSGDQEVPAVETDTGGTAKFHLTRDASQLRFKLTVTDAVDVFAVAGAHIHCEAAGANGPVAAFLAFPVAGGLDGRVVVRGSLTDGDVIPTGCGSTIAELAEAMRAGNTYVNVHSLANPAGEVRGQIFNLGR